MEEVKNNKQESLIILNSIDKYYFITSTPKRKRILHGINLTLKKGEITGIIGLNGSGKTTMFKVMSGYTSSDEGSLDMNFYDEQDEYITLKNLTNDVIDAEKLRQRISILVSGDLIHPKFTLIDNVDYQLSQLGLDILTDTEDIELINRFNWLALKLGIDKRFFEQTAESFSKGMKQKSSIIASLMHKAEFYLMDEPFVGLDAISVNAVENIIKEIAYKEKAGFVVTSHTITNLINICNQVYVLDRGVLTQHFNIDQLKTSAFIARLICICTQVKYIDTETISIFRSILQTRLDEQFSSVKVLIKPELNNLNIMLMMDKYDSINSCREFFNSDKIKILLNDLSLFGTIEILSAVEMPRDAAILGLFVEESIVNTSEQDSGFRV